VIKSKQKQFIEWNLLSMYRKKEINQTFKKVRESNQKEKSGEFARRKEIFLLLFLKFNM
jgi:hypothetical protein